MSNFVMPLFVTDHALWKSLTMRQRELFRNVTELAYQAGRNAGMRECIATDTLTQGLNVPAPVDYLNTPSAFCDQCSADAMNSGLFVEAIEPDSEYDYYEEPDPV